MFRKYWWMLVLMGILALAVGGCDDSDGDDVDADEAGTVISGRVAQTYVSGALVIADKVTGANGMGDFMTNVPEQDENGNFTPGEVYAYSDSEGNFSLTIPPGYGEYVLLSKGGTVRNSDGERVDALPMMAPMGARNITMITTLAVWAPSLKNKLGADYDVDIANRNGVPWRILQLAKTTEAYLSLWSRDDLLGFVPLSFKLEVLGYLADELDNDGVDIEKKSDMEAAVSVAVRKIVSDDYGLSGIDVEWLVGLFAVATNGIIDAIPDSGDVVEADILANVELAVAPSLRKLQGNRLAFNPTASILPLPNDIAWAESQGRVYLPAPADDPAQAALYTAVNALELKGLSPNTIIAIPLENAKSVDEAALQTNIRLINYSTMLGLVYGALQLGNPMEATPDQIIAGIKARIDVAPQETMGIIQQAIGANMDKIFAGPLKIVQEDNLIKIYPLRPLASGSSYVAVILERACQGPCGAGDPGTLFTDINGIMVRAPQIYEFLKFEEPLVGDAAALEPLRQQYAPLYNDLLPMVGIDKDNTLEIFTFTTADKTLSVQDFGAMAAYLRQFVTGEGNMTLNDLAAAIAGSANLPYSALTAEYSGIQNNPEIPPVTGVNFNPDGEPEPGVFISIDIGGPTPAQSTVPYEFANLESYDSAEKAIAIFQHGWGGSKDNVHALFGANGLSMPAIAMDMPLHGDRTPDGAPSGGAFFTINIPQNRINLYQSYMDMMILLRNLKAGLFDLDGDGAVFIPTFTEPDPDDIPAKVVFVGQSLGAITGAVFTQYNLESIEKSVLTVGGGNLSALLDQATAPSIAGLVDTLGVQRNSNEYFTTLGVLQLLMDPADPVNLTTTDLSGKTLIQSAFGDTVVPNVCNQVLAIAAGHPQMVPVADFTAPPSAEPGWYMFGGAPGYIPHGFLLNPQVETGSERFNPDYVLGAYTTARDQIARFLAD